MDNVGMPNQIVHRGFKIVREGDEGANIRLNIVIFIFVDGLLADADNIGKLLLADARLYAKFL